VRCGTVVRQGQHLANAGSTGWSTGPHLHYQVNAVHPHVDQTCECGADGKACAPDQAAWAAFWSNASYPSLPISFDEWSASSCSDRRMVLPVSQNTQEPGGDVRVASSPERAPSQARDPKGDGLMGGRVAASPADGLVSGRMASPPAEDLVTGRMAP